MLTDLFKEEPSQLFAMARSIAKDKASVFSTPCVVSTHCSVQPLCRHCNWRSMSYLSARYGRSIPIEESSQKARAATEAGIHRSHMASGWLGYDLPDFVYEHVQAMTAVSKLELYGFSGPINRGSLELLKQAGAAGYFCGLELANPTLFERVRPGDDYKARVKTLRDAKEMGLKTWSGFMMGMGEDDRDIADTLNLLKSLAVDSVFVIAFKPVPYTEMERQLPTNPFDWARVVAIARIFMDQAEIFANPDIGIWGVRAGANGFTPMFPHRASEMLEINDMRRKAYTLPDELVTSF